MRFRVLGPVEVVYGHRAVPLPAGRARVVLATLVLHANRVVPIERMIEAAWDGHAPATARTQIHSLVSALRRALADHSAADASRAVVIATGDGGYVLRVEEGDCDVQEFLALLANAREAQAAGDNAGALAAFDRSLVLWRGRAFEGTSSRLLDVEAARLAEERLIATQECARAEVELGRYGEATVRLVQLVEQHPLHEGLRELLIVALYRSGRRGEALAAFHQARQALADELGVDPGPRLQELHRQVLRGEEDADSRDRVAGLPALDLTPRQLPAVARHFTGRADELESLTGLLDDLTVASGTVVVSAIHGTAGIGKTTLAVYWAHQVAPMFPDGQLYVDLRGFDAGGSPVAPAQVIRGFLEALGVPAQRIPADVTARTGLYRSLLAGKRILVLLDNARDTEQVRPLLPGTSGSMVVVTSRNQLTGLIAAQGAHSLALDLLSRKEAHGLLAARLGEARVAAELVAVDDLVNLCARLPLALSMIAARTAIRPDLPLAILVDEVRHAARRLDALDIGDPANNIRAVLSWSYQHLDTEVARMFRLLGVHPGPDVTPNALASLAGVHPGQARKALRDLARAHLVTECAVGRYTFHDLLRAYAIELVNSVDGQAPRREAVHRVLDHYLHTAYGVALLLDRQRDSINLAPARPGVTAEVLGGRAQAMAWFGNERRVLLAAIACAAESGFDTHTWQLAWTMASELDRRGHWHDWVSTQHAALDAAQRASDRTGQATSRRLLGRAYIRLGRFDDARIQLHDALDAYHQLADLTGQARTQVDLAVLCERQGGYRKALEHAELSLGLHLATGHKAGQARARNAIGWYQILLGDHQQAVAQCQEALTLHLLLGNRQGQAETLDSLGYAHHNLGDHQQAIGYYRRALHLYGKVGARYFAADTLVRLGDTHHAAGALRSARAAWREALDILIEVRHPDIDQLRRKLAGPDSVPAGHPAAPQPGRRVLL